MSLCFLQWRSTVTARAVELIDPRIATRQNNHGACKSVDRPSRIDPSDAFAAPTTSQAFVDASIHLAADLPRVRVLTMHTGRVLALTWAARLATPTRRASPAVPGWLLFYRHKSHCQSKSARRLTLFTHQRTAVDLLRAPGGQCDGIGWCRSAVEGRGEACGVRAT